MNESFFVEIQGTNCLFLIFKKNVFFVYILKGKEIDDFETWLLMHGVKNVLYF